MTSRREGGFTIIEVLIAIIMLTIGILALTSSSGSVTRMMDFGRKRTAAAAISQSVLDSLRNAARATSPQCTALAGGTLSPPPPGFTVGWTVTAATQAATITVTVGYRVGPDSRSDAVTSTFYCRP